MFVIVATQRECQVAIELCPGHDACCKQGYYCYVKCKNDSSRIWTRVTESISYKDRQQVPQEIYNVYAYVTLKLDDVDIFLFIRKYIL